MTSKERLLTALKGGTPDKMPVTLFIQSQGHFITQLAPEIDPWDFEALQKRIIDFIVPRLREWRSAEVEADTEADIFQRPCRYRERYH